MLFASAFFRDHTQLVNISEMCGFLIEPLTVIYSLGHCLLTLTAVLWLTQPSNPPWDGRHSSPAITVAYQLSVSSNQSVSQSDNQLVNQPEHVYKTP